MKLIDEILDAIGLYEDEDIDEELDAARESKKAKAEPKRIEKGPFAKAEKQEKQDKPKSIKEIYEDDEDDDEEEEKSSIFSFPFFKKKKETVEESEELAPKAEAPKASPFRSAVAKNEAREEAPKKSFFSRKDKEVPAKEEAKEEAPKRSFMDRFRSKNKDSEGNRSMPITVRNKEVNVMVIEPTSFDDCPKIADYLRNNQPVVINFETLDPLVAKRMADFICGSVYAINGSMKKLGRSILICAPRNVDIDAAAQYDVGEEGWKK